MNKAKKANNKQEEMSLREDADLNITEEALQYHADRIAAAREMVSSVIWQDGISKRQSVFEAAYTRLTEACEEEPRFLMGEDDFRRHATAANDAKKAHAELCSYTLDVRTVCNDHNGFVDANVMFIENPVKMNFCYENRGIISEPFTDVE